MARFCDRPEPIQAARPDSFSPRPVHGWFQQQVDASGRIWLLATGANPSGQWGTSTYSIDRGNLTQGWMKHGRLWPTIPGGAPGSTFGYQSGPSAYDRVANRIWRAADYATEDGVASIDVAQAVAAGQQSSAGPKVPGSTIYPVALGGNPFGNSWSVITTGLSPRSWIVGSIGESRLYVMDLENNPGTFVTRTTSGAPDGWTEGVGAVYHAPSRAILVGGMEYGAKIRKLRLSTDDPLTATYTWSEVSPAAANTIVPAVGGDQYRGTFSKFQMIEDMGNGQAALLLRSQRFGSAVRVQVAGRSALVMVALFLRCARGTLADVWPVAANVRYTQLIFSQASIPCPRF